MSDIRDAMLVARDSSHKLTRRPLSPHISIYRWPVTMAASILNRATGIALAAGALLLVWWLVALASGPAEFNAVQLFLGSPLGLFMLLGWTWSLFYHGAAGIRHLIWDSGRGFDKPGLNIRTWAVFALSALATILVWLLAFLKIGS